MIERRAPQVGPREGGLGQMRVSQAGAREFRAFRATVLEVRAVENGGYTIGVVEPAKPQGCARKIGVLQVAFLEFATDQACLTQADAPQFRSAEVQILRAAIALLKPLYGI